jgi:hypothetical protein
LAVGSSAIGEILSTTENALERIAAQTNREADQVYAGTELQAAQLAQARIQAITALRVELMDRASALAIRFEELLDMLERAEQQISAGAGSDGRTRTAAGASDGAPLVRLRERQRITYSMDSPQNPMDSPQQPRRIVRPRPQGPIAEPRRSRWWQRWFRDAA